MVKKYEFTGKTKKVLGRTLKQIVCVTAFASVSAGDVGGWIEKEENLSQYGNAWVSGNARVSGDARVSGNARVYGNARVSGDAWVSGNARVYGNAEVSGDAEVCGDAKAESLVQTINNNYYHVTISDTHIAIGCQNHEKEDWKSFNNGQIKDMDGNKAIEFWGKYREFILMMAGIE